MSEAEIILEKHHVKVYDEILIADGKGTQSSRLIAAMDEYRNADRKRIRDKLIDLYLWSHSKDNDQIESALKQLIKELE